MAKKSVKIEGVSYSSKTSAAKALVAAGKTISEAAKATGITYATVYANTKAAEAVSKRRVKYRVLAIGKKGKLSVGEIAKNTGLSTSAVIAILKKNSVAIVTKKNKEEGKTTEVKKTAKARSRKIVKPENVIDIPEGEIPFDDVAAAAALSDMTSEVR